MSTIFCGKYDKFFDISPLLLGGASLVAYSLHDSAAQTDLFVVEHDILSRARRALRLVAFHAHAAVFENICRRGEKRLTMPDARHAAKNGVFRRMRDKVELVAFDEIVEKSLRGAAIWDEVKDRLKKSALGLSGGQQQRLCIARALAVEPEVLLMDEPTSALDPISTSRVEELAMDLKKDYTIVIVTHNMQQAARISDKTAFFLLGELVEMGPTERLFANPSDKRTEDYISGRFG